MADPKRTSRGPVSASSLRDVAIEIARALVDAGHTAYFAGGCPKDYDIATSATPDEIKAVFPGARGVGESFGVMLVRRQRHIFEVATFRTDGVYSDARRPDDVVFSDAEHDAQRRDFTINGLFEDPLRDEVIDYVGGRADMEKRIVRAIGSPGRRFAEDHLRILRAIRFAATFGFSLDPDTAEAIRAHAGHLRGVSRERIGQEVRRMLTDRHRAVAAWEMQYLGVDATVLREQNVLSAPTRLGLLPDECAYPVALAAWMLDRIQASDASYREIIDRWTGALMLSNEEQQSLIGVLSVYVTLGSDWTRLGVAHQKRLAAGQHFQGGLLLVQAADRDAFIAVRRRVAELAETGLAPEPLIDGNDLIESGMEPGPLFSRVLDGVYDAQLEGQISTRAEAMSLAMMIAEAGGDE